jgi:hypothetical protein
MEQNKLKSNRGGPRPNSGRPKGGTNKISAIGLIATAERVIGKPFIESLMEGYKETIDNGDRKTRVVYEKMIVDKIIGDKAEIEVTNSEDIIHEKAQAFAEALAALSNKDKQ